MMNSQPPMTDGCQQLGKEPPCLFRFDRWCETNHTSHVEEEFARLAISLIFANLSQMLMFTSAKEVMFLPIWMDPTTEVKPLVNSLVSHNFAQIIPNFVAWVPDTNYRRNKVTEGVQPASLWTERWGPSNLEQLDQQFTSLYTESSQVFTKASLDSLL